MDAYGDTLYNIYGSTECAWATIATPEDLRAAPGTAGMPPLGTEVALFDDADEPVPVGARGPDLRAQLDAVRGLYRRWLEGPASVS